MAGQHWQAIPHGGYLEVVADPGQHRKSPPRLRPVRVKAPADIGGVEGAVPKAAQVHLIVARNTRDTLQIAVGIQAVFSQDDPSETTWRRVGGVDRQAAPTKILHGFHLGAAEEPEQWMIGVDAEGFPFDAVGQSRQQGPAQTDRRDGSRRRSVFQLVPSRMATWTPSSVVALLVGHIGDQFLVETPPEIGQIYRVHRSPRIPAASRLRSVHCQAPVDRKRVAGGGTGSRRSPGTPSPWPHPRDGRAAASERPQRALASAPASNAGTSSSPRLSPARPGGR